MLVAPHLVDRPASRGLEREAVGYWESWDLGVQERKEPNEEHKWKDLGIQEEPLVIPGTWKVFSETHNTLHSAHLIT